MSPYQHSISPYALVHPFECRRSILSIQEGHEAPTEKRAGAVSAGALTLDHSQVKQDRTRPLSASWSAAAPGPHGFGRSSILVPGTGILARAYIEGGRRGASRRVAQDQWALAPREESALDKSDERVCGQPCDRTRSRAQDGEALPGRNVVPQGLGDKRELKSGINMGTKLENSK